jgi:hypothetical protein
MPKQCHSAECCLNAANEIDWTTKARQTANIFVNLSITCSLNSVSSDFSFFTGLSLSLFLSLSWASKHPGMQRRVDWGE